MFRLNPTHASSEPRLSRFHSGNLVEASVSMLGRTFTTAIREGATTNDLIEKVARENGGEVTKKYYPEFKTWEITSVRIGDAVLVKSSESGIHFSLGEAGIPMAVTEKQGIVFPNAEELRIGRNTRNIALWTTSANFDPGNIADIDRMYSSRGGAVLSKDARDELSKAHGGVRSGNGVLLEENILVLNKDTGEILTVSQHAAREPESIMFSAGPVLASSAYSSSAMPAAFSDARPSQHEPMARYDPALFDAFRSRMNDASSLIIKTFDGSIADSVTVRFNPFSQDERGPALFSLPQAADSKASVARTQNPISAPAQRLSFCLLAFSSIMPTAATPASAAQPANRPDAASTIRADGASLREAIPDIPDLRRKKAAPIRKEIPATPSFESAYRAWKASRFSRARLDIPAGFSAPVKPGKKGTLGNPLGISKDKLRRNIQATLDTAAKLLSIMALLRKIAIMTAQKAPIGPGTALKNQKSDPNQLKDRLARGQMRKRGRAEKTKVPKPEVDSEVRPAQKARKAEARKPVHPGFGLRAAKPKHAKPAKRTLPAPISLKTKTSGRKDSKEERLSYPKAFRAPQTTHTRARSTRLGVAGKKRLPPHFLWEMLNLHWKKRGRKFRMKKNSAP